MWEQHGCMEWKLQESYMASLLKKKLKLYLDTTIPNYMFAQHLPYKRNLTKRLFNIGQEKKYELFISDVVLREPKAAPAPKKTK